MVYISEKTGTGILNSNKEDKHEQGTGNCHRLWGPIQPAGGKACQRMQCILRDLFLQDGFEKIKSMNPKGIILTGGPNSCYEENAATCSPELFRLGIPVLGLCYGAQLMSLALGGRVERAALKEYGKTQVHVDDSSPCLRGYRLIPSAG